MTGIRLKKSPQQFSVTALQAQDATHNTYASILHQFAPSPF